MRGCSPGRGGNQGGQSGKFSCRRRFWKKCCKQSDRSGGPCCWEEEEGRKREPPWGQIGNEVEQVDLSRAGVPTGSTEGRHSRGGCSEVWASVESAPQGCVFPDFMPSRCLFQPILSVSHSTGCIEFLLSARHCPQVRTWP